MKNTISTALIAALVGLGVGFLLFNKNGETAQVPTGEKAAVQSEYTCSMHPQIRQPDPGDCPICGMDLIPATAAASDDNPLVLEMTEAAVKLSDIQTTRIGAAAESAEKTVQLTGKVQANEQEISVQTAHLAGRIEQLFVTFTGEKIRRGQKLATIYAPELITAQRELLEAKKLQDLNPGLIEAARNKLRYLKIGEETIRRMEASETVQENFTIYADASGTVTERMVAVGDYVQRGEPLFSLVDLNKLWVIFDAYEEDLRHIRVGNNIEFTTPAAPGRTFKTTVTFIDPLLNAGTRTAAVRTAVSNKNGLLKPEMLVTGTLSAAAATGEKTALTVPKSAVMWTGKRSVVYVKVPEATVPTFEFREVEIGESTGDNYLILSGLEAGEEVVTKGNFVIDAAAQLNNQASMMNRDVAVKGTPEIEAVIPDFKAETPEAFQKQITALTAEYLVLKDALTASDAAAAQTAAKGTVAAIALVDMSLLKGAAHEFWMQKMRALEAHGGKIAETDDLEKQREQFGFLSTALIETVTAFGIRGEAIYVQYCPMAFDNEGADWLAAEEKILNPYFGEKMLRCGVVKETIE